MLQWVQRKLTAKGSPGTTCPAAFLTYQTTSQRHFYPISHCNFTLTPAANMYSSSIEFGYDQKSTHSHQGSSKLRRLIRRLQRRPEDEVTGSAYLPHHPAESIESCVSNFPSESEMFDKEDIAWSRPSSRSSRGPQKSYDQHAYPASLQGDYAEMLDDENSAWVRPSKFHRRTRRS
ncbi:hypothetical protein K466DRAFT_581342 [Polyporus arcularius HHB13444]|uniref:Uncharacterized protein n=1 Tax=Polyporus arcularius HHB13444 TaxID=1314778 RepID=A0A5C3Q3I2_9APHY|nr:hypothetical protein K466DRAFT_581342 [Polyporus arcularius HHB13444]